MFALRLFCRKTKNVQPNANTIGLKINFGLLNTLGIFLLIINGIYNMIAIFNNSDACKFINPKFIQLLKPLISLPITNVSNNSDDSYNHTFLNFNITQ